MSATVVADFLRWLRARREKQVLAVRRAIGDVVGAPAFVHVDGPLSEAMLAELRLALRRKANMEMG